MSSIFSDKQSSQARCFWYRYQVQALPETIPVSLGKRTWREGCQRNFKWPQLPRSYLALCRITRELGCSGSASQLFAPPLRSTIPAQANRLVRHVRHVRHVALLFQAVLAIELHRSCGLQGEEIIERPAEVAWLACYSC